MHVLGDYNSPVIPVLIYVPGKISAFSKECYARGLAVSQPLSPPRWIFLACVEFPRNGFNRPLFCIFSSVLPFSRNRTSSLEAKIGSVAMDRAADVNWAVGGTRACRDGGEGGGGLCSTFCCHLLSRVCPSGSCLTFRLPSSAPLRVFPLSCLVSSLPIGLSVPRQRWSSWDSRRPRSSPAVPASASRPGTPGRTWSTPSRNWKRWWTSASSATAAAPWGTEESERPSESATQRRRRWRTWGVLGTRPLPPGGVRPQAASYLGS